MGCLLRPAGPVLLAIAVPDAMAGAKLPIPAAGAQTVVLAMAALGLLLLLGTLLGKRLGSRRWGIPEALLAGTIGLLLGPSGPLPRPLLKAPLIAVWQPLPLILLTLVFATLLLGKPLPRPRTLWRPLSAQVLLAIILALGQYLVAALVVLLLPLPGLHPLMGCLIEVAYEGGHGSAAAMGPTYARLGLESGEALGLALATVGLLASTLVGGLLVLLGRRFGWVRGGAVETGPPADDANVQAASAAGIQAAPALQPGSALAALEATANPGENRGLAPGSAPGPAAMA